MEYSCVTISSHHVIVPIITQECPLSTAPRWPRYSEPTDLVEIELTPLDDRALPATTYDLLQEAASQWVDNTAVTVLPDGTRWQEPVTRSYRTFDWNLT
jgi:hypothetical protein